MGYSEFENNCILLEIEFTVLNLHQALLSLSLMFCGELSFQLTMMTLEVCHYENCNSRKNNNIEF